MSQLRREDQQLTKIANLQKFNGTFDFNQNLAEIIGLPMNTMQREKKSNWTAEAWATVLVLAFFVAKLENVSKDWELLADKSKSWLSENVDETVTEQMFEKALFMFS